MRDVLGGPAAAAKTSGLKFLDDLKTLRGGLDDTIDKLEGFLEAL